MGKPEEHLSEVVSFAVIPQRMVFRASEWRGGVVLMGESPSVVDAGSAGFSIRLTAEGAMRLGRMLYKKGKAVADGIEQEAASGSPDTATKPAASPVGR